MAGYVMMGVSSSLDPKALEEFRGQSYAIGSDADAITLPNFMNHYKPVKKGSSVGTHFVTTCNSKPFFLLRNKTFPLNLFFSLVIGDSCSQSQYRPDQDYLNGALSGAMAFNLQVELGYVLSRKAQTLLHSLFLCLTFVCI